MDISGPFFGDMKMKMKKMSYWLHEKRCYYSLQQQNLFTVNIRVAGVVLMCSELALIRYLSENWVYFYNINDLQKLPLTDIHQNRCS